MSVFQEALQRGARSMGMEMDALALERMEAFHRLLIETNKVMNLTAVTEDMEALDRHYLDSIAPLGLSLIGGTETIADVGTGAGFPAMPLLIARPTLRVTFVDSLQKRLNFIENALETLGLEGSCVHMRAEDFGKSPLYREQFDLATARAVASLPVLMEYLLPAVKLNGAALCWKGPGESVEEAAKAIALLGGGRTSVHPYEIPGRDWGHLLIRVEKQAKTPGKYPRKAGMPARNPL